LSLGWKKTYIQYYNNLRGGCFYRLKKDKLLSNHLIYDYKQIKYDIRNDLYSPGSDVESIFSKYFKVIYSEEEGKALDSNLVIRIHEQIFEYKKNLFIKVALNKYCIWNDPFLDEYMKLARYILLSGLPEEALPALKAFQLRHLHKYDRRNLTKLMDRLEKYDFSEPIKIDMKKLLQEFKF